ncbi:hypothetical protein [Clostridium sp. 'White wine YQ']|uniref:hypothetical protein n=1 Tax=Clostridium sp. 'White wine YQ' TaxID=3027474 RepID=UPI0023672C3A|nr:hypothetical protein [Clostridium sp. 'White wine YQ']MDD7793701.1 hypothetical protein [Clostridium sp. 'White wine YQ']
MFEYKFEPGTNVKILTPFNIDFNQIKKEITQTPECIRNLSTYPNGLVLDMYQYSDKIVVKSNKELIDNTDGTLSVKL